MQQVSGDPVGGDAAKGEEERSDGNKKGEAGQGGGRKARRKEGRKGKRK